MERLRGLLDNADYAIFDFDGTLYPGLFIFDLTKKVFERRDSAAKLAELLGIANEYKSGRVVEAYCSFLELLKGERVDTFREEAENLMHMHFNFADKVIDELKHRYGMKVYVISITSDFIGEAARKHFGFDRVFAVPYLYEGSGKDAEFNGKSGIRIDRPELMKAGMLSELRKEERGDYVSFFDSKDDAAISASSILSVAINPREESVKADLVIRSAEPWMDLRKLL